MSIRYGTTTQNIDVTSICMNRLLVNGTIIIPSSDHLRAFFFSDPVVGALKSVFINNTGYDHTKTIYVNTETFAATACDPANKLRGYQAPLKIKYGTFQEENPEQEMAAIYIRGEEKVLEIGGNIGRNSLIIANILKKKNNNNFVVMECDKNISNQLANNRDLNGFDFKIESSALSKRKLIQKGWDTIVSDIVLNGYKPVDTITFADLTQKYNIVFDTLVLDCEGAFYYILMDMPEILDNITLIIMENDYHNITPKNYIDTVLKERKFSVCYSRGGGWGPCSSKFFEVWKR